MTDFVKSEKSAPRDQPLPLIHHTFKSPERRPDESFSIVFTFLVSVPFFLFLLLVIASFYDRGTIVSTNVFFSI